MPCLCLTIYLFRRILEAAPREEDVGLRILEVGLRILEVGLRILEVGLRI